MTYSDSMGDFDSRRPAQQADLERIVRRALRANTGRSGLARRVLREAEGLAAHGLQPDSPQAVREIACRLARDLSNASAPQGPIAQPRLGATVPGGTILPGATVLVAAL